MISGRDECSDEEALEAERELARIVMHRDTPDNVKAAILFRVAATMASPSQAPRRSRDPMIVPRLKTPVPFAALPAALDAGHREAFGYSLSDQAYAIAASQLELEHGTVTIAGDLYLRGVFDDNLGNHDATRDERADPSTPVFQTVPEHEDGPKGPYTAEHVRVAYPDAVEGAKGYWRALSDGFPDAYQACVDGDPAKFVEALKAEHYFTGPELSYERAVDGRVAAWTARIEAADAA